MDEGETLLWAATVLLIAILTLFGLGSAQAKIVVPGNATIDADHATVTGVVAMFERAEQAVKTHELETLLSFYSSGLGMILVLKPEWLAP